MIKKLRRRIIIINMALIGTVILGIFTAVNINSYTNSVKSLEQGINQLLERDKRFEKINENGEKEFKERDDDDSDDKPDDEPPFDDETPRFEKSGPGNNNPIEISSYIIVTLDSNGEITEKQETNVTMDETDLQECINRAKNQNGEISDYSLMYVRREMMGQTKIAFASTGYIYTNLQSSLIISSVLFVGSLAVIFLISLFLSGLAVKPVQKAWDQQKQFVADASHELKTPLTVILANNNIMMSHKDSKVSDEQQWLESTQEEANHMKKLIDEMLFLAKSDAGETNLQMSDVDFSEIVEGCALNFEPVAFEKEVVIDTQIDPGIVINGNATQLNQLAHILVDNAVKYADNGTKVTIVLNKKSDRTHFSVNNFGSVISKEDMEHIFDRFYRAEKSRTTKGYGLGLSIAQRIVQSMKGKLTVESSEANGTTFSADI